MVKIETFIYKRILNVIMAKKNKPILENATLCSIVRNESINPAGGIENFIHSIVPYVGKAVILDTGSTDRTKEILHKMKKIYGNLEVYDDNFRNYADSRNQLLDKVENNRLVLVMDADEIISDNNYSIEGGIANLARFVKENPASAYNLFMKHYYGNKEDKKRWLIDRLFYASPEKRYVNEIKEEKGKTAGGKEFVYIGDRRQRDSNNTIVIPEHIAHLVHFQPDKETLRKRHIIQYNHLAKGEEIENIDKFLKKYRSFNKTRENYSPNYS